MYYDVISLNSSPGKLSVEAIQIIFEELRKKGNKVNLVTV